MKTAAIERNAKETGKKLVPFTLTLDTRQYAEGQARVVPDTIRVAPIGKWNHPV